MRSGQWWWGKNVREFEEKFAEHHGAKFGITCTNGTTSLQLVRRLGAAAVVGDEEAEVLGVRDSRDVRVSRQHVDLEALAGRAVQVATDSADVIEVERRRIQRDDGGHPPHPIHRE